MKTDTIIAPNGISVQLNRLVVVSFLTLKQEVMKMGKNRSKNGICTVLDNEDNAIVCTSASSRKRGAPCEFLKPRFENGDLVMHCTCDSATALNGRLNWNETPGSPDWSVKFSIPATTWPNDGHGNTGNKKPDHVNISGF